MRAIYRSQAMTLFRQYITALGGMIVLTSILVPSSVYASTYQGCFRDQGAVDSIVGHDLTGYRQQSSTTTVESCAALCGRQGFSYAGVAGSDVCFCGNTFGSQGRLGDDGCQIPCAGDNRQSCGGANAVRVVNALEQNTSAPAVQAEAPATGQPPAGGILGALIQGGVQAYADKQKREQAAAERDLERERMHIQMQQQQLHQQQAQAATASQTATLSGGGGVSAQPSPAAPQSSIQGIPADVNGWNVKRAAYPGGEIAHTDEGWTMVQAGKSPVTLGEQYRADWSVHLFDEAAGAKLEVNLQEKQIFYSDPRTPKKPLHQIVGASK